MWDHDILLLFTWGFLSHFLLLPFFSSLLLRAWPKPHCRSPGSHSGQPKPSAFIHPFSTLQTVCAL